MGGSLWPFSARSSATVKGSPALWTGSSSGGFFFAIRHFCFTLEGQRFAAFVDHKQLTFATGKFSEPRSGRQQRQLSSISESANDIQHEAGKDNFVADCLVQVLAGSVHLDQAMNSEAQAYQWIPTALNMEDVVFDKYPTLCFHQLAMSNVACWLEAAVLQQHPPSFSTGGEGPLQRCQEPSSSGPGLQREVRAWAACQHMKVTH